MTPAQASGRYDFVDDYPVQGPTDPGMRAASCWWKQNVLPVEKPACVDCNGPIPRWANRPTSWGGGWPQYGGRGGPNCRRERIHHSGRHVHGFALDAAGDPAATLSSDQQAWVVSTLSTLNQKIASSTGTSCPGWQEPGTSLAAAVGCFQLWATSNGRGPVRSDGVLDEDTLCALISVVVEHQSDFPTPFPDPSGQRCYGGATTSGVAPAAGAPVSGSTNADAAPVSGSANAAPPSATPVPPPPPPPPAGSTVPEPPPVTSMSKHGGKHGGGKHDQQGGIVSSLQNLSTPTKVGIGVASIIVVGGVVFAATRKRKS
jgi:hypothetical protein